MRVGSKIASRQPAAGEAGSPNMVRSAAGDVGARSPVEIAALQRSPGAKLPSVVRAVIALLLVTASTSCGANRDHVPVPEGPMTVNLTSPAFAEGDTIPDLYTCDGDDVSPPLEWSDVPPDAAQLAVVVEDPDAPGGTFVHWVLWGLDAGLPGLAQGQVPAGAREGRNDFGRIGWGGPCPPRGSEPHHYVFTLLALSEPLAVEAGASADRVKRAAEGKVLAAGRLTGRYGR